MLRIGRIKSSIVRASIAFAFLMGYANFQFASGFELPAQCDPTKVVTAESCVKCHAAEYKVWQRTPHFRTFEQLHRTAQAKQIAQRMGISSIKRGGICVDCHYTPKQKSGKVRVVSGVSCESCHGAARDWISVHNDYGQYGTTPETESKEHRLRRLTTSIQLGMRNPNNLYLIARSCLNCHTVPNEKLVNVGGHNAGTLDFDLVKYSQGMVRHNFLRGKGINVPSDQNRIRVMYLSGIIADLEFSTRATGKATSRGRFGMTVANRAAQKAIQLKKIQDQLKHPLIEKILAAFAKAELRTNNSRQLEEIANVIQKHGQQLAFEIDGSQLAFLDELIPSPSQYK